MAHSYLPKWYNDLPKAKYTSSVIIQNWFKESYGHVPNLGKCLRFCWVVNFAPYPYVHNKFWFQPSLKLVIIHIHTYIHHITWLYIPLCDYIYIYTIIHHCMVKLWLYIYIAYECWVALQVWGVHLVSRRRMWLDAPNDMTRVNDWTIIWVSCIQESKILKGSKSN